MKWFKKPRDLYDLLLLEDLFFGNTGSYTRRVPGGWIFYQIDAMGTVTGVFVPFSSEFQNLSDEEIKSLSDEDLAETKDPETGKIGHKSRPG